MDLLLEYHHIKKSSARLPTQKLNIHSRFQFKFFPLSWKSKLKKTTKTRELNRIDDATSRHHKTHKTKSGSINWDPFEWRVDVCDILVEMKTKFDPLRWTFPASNESLNITKYRLQCDRMSTIVGMFNFLDQKTQKKFSTFTSSHLIPINSCKCWEISSKHGKILLHILKKNRKTLLRIPLKKFYCLEWECEGLRFVEMSLRSLKISFRSW